MYSGDTNQSAVLYDSLRADNVPFEGVISDGSSIRIDFFAEEPAATMAFNIRFEGDRLPSVPLVSASASSLGIFGQLSEITAVGRVLAAAKTWCSTVLLSLWACRAT